MRDLQLTRSTVLLAPARTRPLLAGARLGLSLHNHSSSSRESLDFLPGIARQVPRTARVVGILLARFAARTGAHLDVGRMYWRPPLEPAAVVAAERWHVAERLDLEAAVALTDHDTMAGPRALRRRGDDAVPLSLEWTAAFGGAVFHFGVHNLSPNRADEAERHLSALTRAPDDRRLIDLLAWLDEDRDGFVILNHPLWDLGGLGPLQHEAQLLALLRRAGTFVHALELNGYRRWSENVRVLPIAEGFGLPLVAAGDRHGCAPSSMLTVTGSPSLAAFARDLRAGCRTTCVVLPEYREPFASRLLEGVRDAVRPHPDHSTGACRWIDRVFVDDRGTERPLSAVWPRGGPYWLRTVVSLSRVMGASPLRSVYRLALSPDGQG